MAGFTRRLDGGGNSTKCVDRHAGSGRTEHIFDRCSPKNGGGGGALYSSGTECGGYMNHRFTAKMLNSAYFLPNILHTTICTVGKTQNGGSENIGGRYVTLGGGLGGASNRLRFAQFCRVVIFHFQKLGGGEWVRRR